MSRDILVRFQRPLDTVRLVFRSLCPLQESDSCCGLEHTTFEGTTHRKENHTRCDGPACCFSYQSRAFTPTGHARLSPNERQKLLLYSENRVLRGFGYSEFNHGL